MRKFYWWYKGKTPEGNICKFEGDGKAPDAASAIKHIEAMMRKQYPEMAWMHGNQVETAEMKYGPTIRMGKLVDEKS